MANASLVVFTPARAGGCLAPRRALAGRGGSARRRLALKYCASETAAPAAAIALAGEGEACAKNKDCADGAPLRVCVRRERSKMRSTRCATALTLKQNSLSVPRATLGWLACVWRVCHRLRPPEPVQHALLRAPAQRDRQSGSEERPRQRPRPRRPRRGRSSSFLLKNIKKQSGQAERLTTYPSTPRRQNAAPPLSPLAPCAPPTKR